MLTREIFTTENTLSAEERLEIYRRKRWCMKLQNWWSLTHDGEALILDDIILDLRDTPTCLRRQAE